MFDGAIFDRAIFDTGEEGHHGGGEFPVHVPVKRGRTIEEIVRAIRDDDDLLTLVPELVRTMNA